jgi:hypothetical protein
VSDVLFGALPLGLFGDGAGGGSWSWSRSVGWSVGGSAGLYKSGVMSLSEISSETSSG